ncbi:transporter substrate-binding domain-containing protein [Erwinia aphidicola]|nr:transporter substrate-binding domain-containing protein [Erwinia aphidicola]
MAVINGTRISATIRNQYPHIVVVNAASATEALAMLSRGQVDAAINTLANSEYQIARYYRNRMRISATLGETPAFISFAVPQQSQELQRIIDKVMLSIPPDEMDVIGNLWRPNNMVASDNFWRENRSLIVIGGAFSAALILVSLVWAIWLRRQIRIKTRVQRKLNDQLEFMHDMINGTPNATYIRDASGRLTQCNDSYLQDLGRTREQVINQSLLENHLFKDEQQTKNYIQDFYEVLSTGNPIFKDRTFSHTGDRQQRTIFHWILPYRDAGGNS